MEAVLWARSNPNPKLQKEVDTKMMRGEENLELQDTEVDDEMYGDGGEE